MLGDTLGELSLPTTDDAKTGSVAVTQAAQTRASNQFRGGTIHQINKLVISQPQVMTGSSNKVTDFQCRSM